MLLSPRPLIYAKQLDALCLVAGGADLLISSIRQDPSVVAAKSCIKILFDTGVLLENNSSIRIEVCRLLMVSPDLTGFRMQSNMYNSIHRRFYFLNKKERDKSLARLQILAATAQEIILQKKIKTIAIKSDKRRAVYTRSLDCLMKEALQKQQIKSIKSIKFKRLEKNISQAINCFDSIKASGGFKRRAKKRVEVANLMSEITGRELNSSVVSHEFCTKYIASILARFTCPDQQRIIRKLELIRDDKAKVEVLNISTVVDKRKTEAEEIMLMQRHIKQKLLKHFQLRPEEFCRDGAVYQGLKRIFSEICTIDFNKPFMKQLFWHMDIAMKEFSHADTKWLLNYVSQLRTTK